MHIYFLEKQSYYKLTYDCNNRRKVGYIDFRFCLNASQELIDLLGGNGNFPNSGNTRGGTREIRYKIFDSFDEILNFFKSYNINLLNCR